MSLLDAAQPLAGMGAAAGAHRRLAPLKVVGVGDPVMDIVAHVSAEFLGSVVEQVHGCCPVEADEMAALLKKADDSEHCELTR